MKRFKPLLCALALLALGGCASMFQHAGARQAGSIVDYLYPDAKEAPKMEPAVTRLRLPVRVGVAFVPGGGRGAMPPDAGQMRLPEKVKAAFSQYDYIGSIELIPGAYLVKGDQYEVQTMVDAAVFDVRSRKLLFRAPGMSQVKGSSTLAGYNREVRGAQSDGYAQAVEQMIPALQLQLASFRERARSDPGIQLERRNGERGAGGFGWTVAVLLAGIAFRTGSGHA